MSAVNSKAISKRIESTVLGVHHRNGGKLAELDFNLRLLDAALLLDSLDLAEIIVSIEREFHFSPFEVPQPPRTWSELVTQVEASWKEKG